MKTIKTEMSDSIYLRLMTAGTKGYPLGVKVL